MSVISPALPTYLSRVTSGGAANFSCGGAAGVSASISKCARGIGLLKAELGEGGRRACAKKGRGQTAVIHDGRFKDSWVASLASPVTGPSDSGEESPAEETVQRCGWAIGVDPDVSGALAIIKGDGAECSAQVFDSPYLQASVGKRLRKRLDAKAIVQLLRSFNAPVGTTAYIEQSIPFPKDGKQGWWSGGFGYGLWIGILVAAGFSVIPVPSILWKTHFELAGSSSSKDDSRKAACELFPSLSSMFRRKMDHGRAEALLIAAYGKGLRRVQEISSSDMT
ncbi:hypothetical protein EJ110_NYTH08365 [Nymphaea thermarum]|nr:hypothetical protein EJ110_NYTH08365 [Nymphaea thermarum]